MLCKNKRLPTSSYEGKCTLSMTLCEKSRAKAFTNPDMIQAFSAVMVQEAQNHRCVIPIYCFMPDHLHILIKGESDESKPKVAIDRFKGVTSQRFVKNQPNWHWQPGYHDHVVRLGHDWKNQAFYILNNPVRAGLIADPYDYPFTGTFGYDLIELFQDLTS